MTNKRLFAAFLACTFLGILNTASAQTKVAIVDIGVVFKNHPVFSQQLESLKQEAEQFKANSVQLQQQLMQKAEVLRQYTPGSAEFKKAESDLAKESAGLEVEQRDKMRTLMQREAKLHFNTYTEVNNLIGQYCDQRQIQLVLRFNSEPMDPSKPGTIMQRVNGSIIYYDQDKDITQKIIAQLVQMNGSANRGADANRR